MSDGRSDWADDVDECRVEAQKFNNTYPVGTRVLAEDPRKGMEVFPAIVRKAARSDYNGDYAVVSLEYAHTPDEMHLVAVSCVKGENSPKHSEPVQTSEVTPPAPPEYLLDGEYSVDTDSEGRVFFLNKGKPAIPALRGSALIADMLQTIRSLRSELAAVSDQGLHAEVLRLQADNLRLRKSLEVIAKLAENALTLLQKTA